LSIIKRTIRNIKYGTDIRSVLTADEKLMFQKVISCSSNRGILWCGAIVGLTNKRLLIEWQQNKGNDVAVTYDQIVSWQVSNKIGGLSGILNNVLPIKNYISVDICVSEQLTVRILQKRSIMEIFVNHLREYCPEKQK